MKNIFILAIVCLMSFVVRAQTETKNDYKLKKCVGTLTREGSVVYKEDCMAPSNKIVKKGIRHNVISGPVDTPQKAMELYNKTKDEATTLEREDTGSER